MYKETVARRKVPSIFIIVLYLTTYLVVSDIITNLRIGQYIIGEYLTILLTFLVFFTIVRQVNKCKIKYKYSIIADELIIYKLKGCREEVIESIKLKDIEYVEKISKFKFNLNRFFCKKCACLNFINDVYACKYSNGYRSGKFYFEPSYKLVDKINILRSREIC
ncbi:MAG: hypothetical protein VB130_02010 [Clostridium sp.]|nr:hypothetical protein [Clostridium sp.]